MSEFASSSNSIQEDLFSLNSVSVYNSPLHGNGVIATKPLIVGDIAFNGKYSQCLYILHLMLNREAFTPFTIIN